MNPVDSLAFEVQVAVSHLRRIAADQGGTRWGERRFESTFCCPADEARGWRLFPIPCSCVGCGGRRPPLCVSAIRPARLASAAEGDFTSACGEACAFSRRSGSEGGRAGDADPGGTRVASSCSMRSIISGPVDGTAPAVAVRADDEEVAPSWALPIPALPATGGPGAEKALMIAFRSWPASPDDLRKASPRDSRSAPTGFRKTSRQRGRPSSSRTGFPRTSSLG